MKRIVNQHVCYLTPGTFFSEDVTKDVPNRSIKGALKKMPKDAYAFYFYASEVFEHEGEKFIKIGSKFRGNRSRKYYPGGKIFTTEELEREYPGPEYEILRKNCEYNGGKAVLTRMGNWQLFDKGDQIVEEIKNDAPHSLPQKALP
jgi:hypothetical protein